MYPTGTKFNKFFKEWEIIKVYEELDMYYCVTRSKKNGKLEFRDFKASELEGVEVINGI